jgi:hypothetical protein
MPSIFIKLAANGEGWGGASVERGVRYSIKGDDNPGGSIGWFGRNLRASGFGVFSVCMKILRLPPTDGGRSIVEGWCKGCNDGLNLEFDGATAGNLVFWCICLIAEVIQVASGDLTGLLLVRNGRVDRNIRFGAIVIKSYPQTDLA